MLDVPGSAWPWPKSCRWIPHKTRQDPVAWDAAQPQGLKKTDALDPKGKGIKGTGSVELWLRGLLRKIVISFCYK